MQAVRFLCVVVLGGYLFSSFATDSRVMTMGRHDNFFMDDISIYDNPANVNVYPNMLFGDLGRYAVDPELDAPAKSAGLARYNRDPQKPFFGGILSYSLNRSAEAGDQYPMLSIGAVLNRYDDMLDYISPNSGNYAGTDISDLGDTSLVMKPATGKMDLLVGYALKNGGMIGVGGYLAFQKETEDGITLYESSLYKVNAGMNWPLSKTMDIEVSAGGAQITGTGQIIDSVTKVIVSRDTQIVGIKLREEIVADGDLSFRADVRLFSAMTILNGDFVPHIGFELRNLAKGEKQVMDVNGGIGLNLNIDRGFFWAGVEGLYESTTLTNNESTVRERLGGRLSFGIERNIVWDWFLLRAGGQKKIMYEKTGTDSGRWFENVDANASNEDMLGIGAGVNIENRLKIDGIVAEDIFYTFTNLISGNHHHIMTRISATYSF